MAKSVLFLAYLFPPRGGAGVQRALKFVKYLPEFGWRPLVVANGGVEGGTVTAVTDQSLMKDLEGGATVRHTSLNDYEMRVYEMGLGWRRRLEATDPMRWWVGPAVRAGVEIGAGEKVDLIFVTASPFTSVLAGLELKERLGVPLVVDLRDPWALDETRIYPSRWHAWRDWRAMRKGLEGADLVIMNTPVAMELAGGVFGAAIRKKMVVITNGFDGADFVGDLGGVAASGGDELRIVHTGMFHSELAGVWDNLRGRKGLANWVKYARRPINLWARTPRYLMEAMERVAASGEIGREKMQLVLVGEVTEGDRKLVEGSGMADRVRMLGYRSHVESVGWVKSADVLFLPNHVPLDGGDASIVPGKTYEYLGSGRPILGMGPGGDMREFVGRGGGVCVGGEDVAGAAEVLVRFYKSKLAGEVRKRDEEFVAGLERRSLARELARVMEGVLGGG